MAFITGQTNRRISNKDPEDYLQKIVDRQGPAALEAQQVSVDPRLWKMDNYREFLQTRREGLAQRMNDFIRVKAGL